MPSLRLSHNFGFTAGDSQHPFLCRRVYGLKAHGRLSVIYLLQLPLEQEVPRTVLSTGNP